ncbi:MAG: trigger factor [Oscillospiraceae bacterium]|nr:trigger factor [Oscillospiraceae bacterium]
MNLISMERDENNLVTLTIGVDADTFHTAVSEVARREAGRYSVPGFRRGKAPRRMIETIYGPGVFYEGAVNQTYLAAYGKVVVEQDLETVEKPDIEVLDIGPEGYSFKASVHVYPEAEVSGYRGLHAYKPPVEVKIDDIDAELARLQERNARLVAVSRPIQNNDIVTLDFEGFIDDIPFDGGKAQNHQLEIGSGRFIPGFEEALIGRVSEEECQVKVTFPEDYHVDELAGEDAVFEVRIRDVKEHEMPDLDDEFAKDVSNFDTLEELRGDIREKLEKEKADKSENAFFAALNKQVRDATTVNIPECMIEEEQSYVMGDFQRGLAANGMDYATYKRVVGLSDEDMQRDMHDRARQKLTLRLGYEKIAELEGLEVPSEEIEAAYAKEKGEYGEGISQEAEDMIKRRVRRNLLIAKAIQFVKDDAFADSQPPEEVSIPHVSESEE